MNLIYTFVLTSLSLIYKMDIITGLGCSPGGSEDKDSAFNEGDQDLIPESGRCPGEGSGYPLQCWCLENSMDRGAWRATVPEVTKSWTRLSD